MTLDISPDHNAARQSATVAFADLGPNPSTIALYATTQPARGADPGGIPMATLVLTKPCGTVAGGVITLQQADTDGDLIFTTGTPTWARWLNGAGDLVADGTVSSNTAPNNTGDFQVDGTGLLYAGARARLGTSTLG